MRHYLVEYGKGLVSWNPKLAVYKVEMLSWKKQQPRNPDDKRVAYIYIYIATSLTEVLYNKGQISYMDNCFCSLWQACKKL